MTERKRQYVVGDRDGMIWGPFPDSQSAAVWARAKWPNQAQQPDGSVNLHYDLVGWYVALLLDPNE